MATQVQNRRGTTAEHSTFTGAVGEVTIDTDKDTAVVHDGSTAGGRPLLREDLSNLPAGAIDNADINASAAIAGTKISPNFGSQNVTTTGTATAASFIPTSSTVPTNGVYLPAANSVALSTNGTGRLFVDSSGRVGIGVASPQGRIHSVATSLAGASYRTGAPLILENDVNNELQILSGSTSYGQLRFGDGDSNYRGAITYDHSVDAFTMVTAGSERLRITSTGLVGIGTSSPTELLEIKSNTAPTFRINNGTAILGADQEIGSLEYYTNDSTVSGGINGTGIAASIVAFSENSFGVDTYLSFRTRGDQDNTANANERLRIDSAGRVGIGTTPLEKFHVNVGTNQNITFMSGGAGDARIQAVNDAGTGVVGLSVTASPFLFRGSTGNEVGRWDSSGRLLVGTSTARSGFVNDGAISAALQLEGAAGTYSDSKRFLSLTYNVADNYGPNIVFAKSRSNSLGGVTRVQSGDEVGGLYFCGADDTDLPAAASIVGYVDGTPGANDMPGRLVFSTTADGASSPTERLRITNDSVMCYDQAAPVSYAAAATLVVGDLKNGLIQYTGAAATLTLPTGTLTEGGFSGIYTNMTFEWSVINTGSGTCTIGAGSGHTIVGGATVAAGASGRFASRRTAANTFVSYRLS